MNMPGTGVLVLFMLLLPVSCLEVFPGDPVTCFLLDGILILYCVVATVLYFRVKFCFTSPVVDEVVENDDQIYEDIERPVDVVPDQVLQPPERKRRVRKKKKSEDPSSAVNLDIPTLPPR